MNKTIVIDNQTVELVFSPEANCWTTTARIDGMETEIGIDFKFHKEPEVDWDHFKSFIGSISQKGRLKGVIADSMELVTALGKAFARPSPEIENWKMEFSGLYYRGKVNEHHGTDAYSLIFYFLEAKDGFIYTDDAFYLVDLEALAIVGARRM